MVSRGDGFVLWPRYFDRSLSRSQGRRVPTSLAGKAPDAETLAAAAKKAGFAATVEADAVDPSKPYATSGRIIVNADGGKESVIRAVAEALARQD